MAVNPSKDVDGFHPENFKNGFGYEYFFILTPYGILELLDRYE
jgi:methylenetetrahydrofolate dehydrogenase (NADP+)/methenyltetrahydrofolate cyclohydrolase